MWDWIVLCSSPRSPPLLLHYTRWVLVSRLLRILYTRSASPFSLIIFLVLTVTFVRVYLLASLYLGFLNIEIDKSSGDPVI